MIKVGITGQAGFIGTHLYNFLSLKREGIQLVPFEDSFFSDKKKFEAFVSSCDAIVHLAAMNRHGDPLVIYDTNIALVKQLIETCECTGSTPHILFSSSSQEERDNPYGRSKREGRMMLESWAERNNASFTGLVIPNVFGPFGNPYYNSVVATFCHQLTHNETPQIDVDGQLRLIFVGELTELIYREITAVNEKNDAGKSKQAAVRTIKVPHTYERKVSEILKILSGFKADYFGKGIIPGLDDPFTRNLFNTFVCYIDHASFFPFGLRLNTDNRGTYVETVKLNSGGQVSFSTTKPGITRGDHYHTRKAERFAVIKGKATIRLRRIGSDRVMSFDLDGSTPSFVDMPVWYTHNITNTGDEELYTIFWINEMYDPEDPDTYYEKVVKE